LLSLAEQHATSYTTPRDATLLTGAAWRVLAHAPEAWKLRLPTSEVAVAEPAAGYQRPLRGLADKTRRLGGVEGRLGAQDEAQAFVEALGTKAETYEQLLRETLDAVRVSITRIPENRPHDRGAARSLATTAL
jgi:hypothetical protein